MTLRSGRANNRLKKGDSCSDLVFRAEELWGGARLDDEGAGGGAHFAPGTAKIGCSFQDAVGPCQFNLVVDPSRMNGRPREGFYLVDHTVAGGRGKAAGL